jgi:hypothetical protein
VIVGGVIAADERLQGSRCDNSRPENCKPGVAPYIGTNRNP